MLVDCQLADGAPQTAVTLTLSTDTPRLCLAMLDSRTCSLTVSCDNENNMKQQCEHYETTM